MPTDLVDAAGSTAADRPLVYQMSRVAQRRGAAAVRRGRGPRWCAASGCPTSASSAAAAPPGWITAAPDDVLDIAARHPGRDGAAASRSRRRSTSRPTSPRAGRRRSTVIRRPRGAPPSVAAGPVGRLVTPAAGDVRPPRPAGRRRRRSTRCRRRCRSTPAGSRAPSTFPRSRRRSANAVETVPVTFAPLTGGDVRDHGDAGAPGDDHRATTSDSRT